MDENGREYPSLIPVEEAQQLVIDSVKPLQTEKVSLYASHGTRLAEALHADHDIPLFDRSYMDGYAVRAEDVRPAGREHPVTLKVIEEIPAGHVPLLEVTSGTASRIMTGAPIPPGADAVIRVEDAAVFPDDPQRVLIYKPVSAGESVGRRGEDVQKGQVLLTEGTLLGPIEMGLLATFGISQVLVYRKPKVGLLSTGSELLAVDEPMRAGKLRDSNSAMLGEQVRRVGGEPLYGGIAPDEPGLLAEKMQGLFQASDILVTSGGVSMGDYDFMSITYRRLGIKTVFWKALIRPGMPVLYGLWEGKPVFSLAGNPGSSFVNAHLFLLPAVRCMAGETKPCAQRIRAHLDHAVAAKEIPHTRYLRGKWYERDGELRVRVEANQSSSVLTSFLSCNGLMKIPGGVGYEEGDLAEVEVL